MSGIVEVKDTEQHCYYRAKLLDIKQDQCLVQYEDLNGGKKGSTWVHQSLVREERPEQTAPMRVEEVRLPRRDARQRTQTQINQHMIKKNSHINYTPIKCKAP